MLAPTIGAQENDVGDATGPAMLKRIIEHDHVASRPLRGLGAGDAVGRDDDRHVGIQRAMDERLVLTVASQHDGWPRTRALETTGEERGERRLAGAADGEIADA